MIALTDVDGVLLNWNDSFRRWMKKQGYTLFRDDAYNLADCYELDIPKMTRLCEQFNASAEMGFLQPIGDSVYWVKRLHRKHGFVFHAITSMGEDHFARKLRAMNLERIFGKTVFEKIVILKCGEDKTQALMEYKDSGLTWIEDNIENANVGTALGLSTFLIDRPYNQDPDCVQNFTRVKNWKQLTRLIAPHN